MEGLDSPLIAKGYPTEPGLHLLWWDHNGWPAIAIVLVQLAEGLGTVWSKLGFGGTDRWQEIHRLFGFQYDEYLGQSRITPEALAHFEMIQQRVSLEVKEMWAAGRKEPP